MGFWCPSWTSNPVLPARSRQGGFDSHTLPPAFVMEGTEMKITHYSFGKIVINGNEYTQDIIVFHDSVFPSWWRKQGHSLCIEDLGEVLKKDVKILVVGTGAYERMQVPQSLIEELKQRGIETFVYETEKAVAVFNQLLAEGKAVAGAFHLTC